jgi:hypothetical protein
MLQHDIYTYSPCIHCNGWVGGLFINRGIIHGFSGKMRGEMGVFRSTLVL